MTVGRRALPNPKLSTQKLAGILFWHRKVVLRALSRNPYLGQRENQTECLLNWIRLNLSFFQMIVERYCHDVQLDHELSAPSSRWAMGVCVCVGVSALL